MNYLFNMGSADRGPQIKIINVMVVFLTVAVAFLLAEKVVRSRHVTADLPFRAVTPRGALAQHEKSTIDLFQKASRSVVHITTLVQDQRMLRLDGARQRKGTGSGCVWDHLGHIVTNFHVVEGSNRFLVTFADQTTLRAELVGLAQHKDLALLRVQASPRQLSPITIGNSDDLRVGQSVYAIGNPFGLDQTLTTGVISGLGREIRSLTNRPISDVVQTDAAINPGNSGGPLLDSSGRLIGVNTAIFSTSGTNHGVGFAIPVDTVRRVIPQLVKYGRVQSPSLGYQAVNPKMTGRVGLNGVLVMSVDKLGAAEQGGVEPFHYDESGNIIYGDLIVAMDNVPIKDQDDVYAALDEYKVGDEVTLTVVRASNTKKSKSLRLKVTLQRE